MPLRFRAAITAAAIILLTLGAPFAAQASSIYPPVDACESSQSAAAAGATITFSCNAGTFGADEAVTVTLTGENAASARFALVRLEVSTLSGAYTSTSSGALDAVRITLPSNSSGIYNIAAVSATSAGGTSSVSALGADGLPSTGGDSSQLLGLWIGGGAVVLAGVVILVAVWLRRRRDDD
ncbi:cell wall protein [Microbacterium memoriense]|uniref:Cell wall protein n=1 Tax=Microbacterium memoriense TaxID=2978350 RepID=A0ABT2PBH3_9MICO|nr:cell wall protein [Microbacterium memoriense]MCT9001950.1 cell wall protein [Microbacterium memoriense]